MKKCLFTYVTDDFQEVLTASQPTHKYFADLFGYDYFTFTENDLLELGIEAGWSTKLELFQYLLEKKDYQLAFWIDADAIFARFEKDIIGELFANSFQAFIMEISSHRWNPNTGVWLMKQGQLSKEFLKETIDNGVVTSCWKDQAAVMNTLGWNMDSFPGGNKLIHPSKYLEFTDWLDPVWNFMPKLKGEITHAARVIHFAGYEVSNKERATVIAEQRDSLQRQSVRRLPWTPGNSKQGHRLYD